MNIRVDLELLENAANQMMEKSQRYGELYAKLYNMVDDLKQHWQGKDQEAFSRQIYGFEDDFVKMHQLTEEYSQFLKKSVQAYRTLQDETERASYRLMQ